MPDSNADRNKPLKAALAALGVSLGVTMVPVSEAGDGSVKPDDTSKAKAKSAASTPAATTANPNKSGQKTDAGPWDHKKWKAEPPKAKVDTPQAKSP